MAGNTGDSNQEDNSSNFITNIDKMSSKVLQIIPEVLLICIFDDDNSIISLKTATDLSLHKTNQIRDNIPLIFNWINQHSYGLETFEVENQRYTLAHMGSKLSVLMISTCCLSIIESLLHCFNFAKKLYRIINKQDTTFDIPKIRLRRLNEECTTFGRICYIGVKPANYLAKLVIIGDKKVGKTSLIRQYIRNTIHLGFKEPIRNNIWAKNIQFPDENTSLMLSIHNMSGLEPQFIRVRTVFFRGTHACFIVFDLTNRESFEHIKLWHTQTMQYAGNKTCVIFIGNKMDQTEHRAVKHEEITALSNELDCLFIETSAKTGENVELAFTVVAVALLLNSQEYFTAPPMVKQALSSITDLFSHSNQ